MATRVSATIVNHGQWRWLAPCLESLDQHPYTAGPFEVTVLDNASNDGSGSELPERFPHVRFIPQQERRGFGPNQNTAIAATEADFVLVLNPDTLMHETAIDQLVAAMQQHESIVLAAGPILNQDGSAWSRAPLHFPTPSMALAQALGLHRLAPEPPAQAGTHTDRWVSGSAFLVRRSAFEAVGGFDESFFLYGEETDLMRRLMDGTRLTAWVPDAVVTHVGRTGGISDVTAKASPTAVELVRGQIRYARKHHGRRGAAVVRVGLGLDALLRWGLSMIGFGNLLQGKGTTIAETRAYHRGRLTAAWAGQRAQGLAEQAAAWNARL